MFSTSIENTKLLLEKKKDIFRHVLKMLESSKKCERNEKEKKERRKSEKKETQKKKKSKICFLTLYPPTLFYSYSQ